MANSNRLYRNFVILQEDERGYANSDEKTLSGYSKVEAKGDRCKISFYAQNLRKDDDYCVVLICCKKDMKQLVNLGQLKVNDTGKAEITKEYNIYNIAGLDLSYDKISGTSIMKIKDGIPICILCGFLSGQQPSDNWKNYKILKGKDIKDKILEKKKEQKLEEKKKQQKEDNCDNMNIINREDSKELKSEKLDEVKSIEVKESIEVKKEEEKVEYIYPKENLRGKFEDYENSIEALKEFDPDKSKIRGSIGEYFEAIAEGFEREKTGFDEIKYTKWYKVPVDNLFQMCNMSNYNKYTLAYYPMLNYYPYIKKYGYFMLGYKCDSKGELKYIVYGVPGKKDSDEQPYDGKTGFVTWINKKSKDDIGCWLMFYDFKNSTVVVPMK